VQHWNGFGWKCNKAGTSTYRRLFSGKPKLEEKNKTYRRGKARTDGMTRILQQLDVRVATELYGRNASTWMFYDRTILQKEADMWRRHQQQQQQQQQHSETSKGITPVVAIESSDKNLVVVSFIQKLLKHADTSMNVGPWSVIHKQPCGCGKYNDRHDYYRTIGHNTLVNKMMRISSSKRKFPEMRKW
jgi:hypothetical protein